jgi:nucleoside-diphosphate-sugar epimerase
MSDGDRTRRRLGRILVTGAAGFLGGALARRLTQDGEEIVLSDLADGPEAPAGLRPCDLRQADEVLALVADQGIDTILHAGAVSGPMVMADRPLDIWRINAMGTAHLLEAARRNRVGRFVLCSSIDVYGAGAAGMVGEDAALAPDSVYGASKVAAEAALAGYACEHGIDGLALRFSWIYGPGRRTPTTLERLIRAGLAGETATLENAGETTHYLNIEDAVAGVIVAAAAPGSLQRCYNITAGQGQPMSRIAEVLGEILPRLHVRFAGRDPLPTGPAGFDQTRAERDLGYRAQVAPGDGLRRYVEALAREAT